MFNAWRLLPGNSIADRRTIPISIDMILRERASYRSPISLQDLAVYTAMIMGYGTASRFSEYLPESKETRGHAILSENVVFVIEGADGRPAMCPSHSSIPDLEKVIGCMVVISDSKNDPKGIGHRFYFPRQPVVPVTRVYDFATDMWTFARRSRPVKGKPFFHCALSGGAGGLSLCQTAFNERLKAMVKR